MSCRRFRLLFQALTLLVPWTAVAGLPENTTPNFPSTTAWINHLRADVLPYWTTPSALGSPVGNFPTFRNMAGIPIATADRHVRALSRQVYVYLIAYSMTGDSALLGYGKRGITWIEEHALDSPRGFHTVLDDKGRPISGSKSAQDQAYIASAYAADFLVTRDSASKRRLDGVVDLMFHGPYWDSSSGMIIDALDNSLSKEVPFENPGTDIVTLLDQVNAYLLLYANQTSGQERRSLLYRLRHLGDLLVARFHSKGIFWNTDINRTDFAAKHVDMGHVLKTYWMLYRISTLWGDDFRYSLYQNVLKNAKPLLIQAYGSDPDSFWGQDLDQMLGVIKTNPVWWIQIELNQFASDLSMKDRTFVELVRHKADAWLNSNFIDRGRAVRGIREGIRWDNSLYGDQESWDAKANKWKNGYHETEHCLILHITSHSVLGKPLTLYFALPTDASTEGLKPYIFSGRITDVNNIGPIDGLDLNKIAVTFVDIH